MKTLKSDSKSAISVAVRALRGALGESQQEFAYRMKTAIRTIARYETTRPPKGRVLAHLKEIAIQNRREDLAEVFAKALAEELEVPSFSGFHLDTAPKNLMEEFYVSVMLSMLRNAQYHRLLPKLNKLAAEPMRECAKRIKAAEEARSVWQQFKDDARKAGVWKEIE